MSTSPAAATYIGDNGSVIVAALVDDGEVGRWAEALLRTDELAAPVLMPIEAANILRRASPSGQISPDAATLAHGDLGQLPVALFPYALLAEVLDAPLVTLDLRLARTSGLRCAFQTPPD